MSASCTKTKHAINGLTEAMPKGVPRAHGERQPGLVIDVGHVANSVLHMASLPLDTNVQFMTTMATKMAFVGRGKSGSRRISFF